MGLNCGIDCAIVVPGEALRNSGTPTFENRKGWGTLTVRVAQERVGLPADS
jgi:hypothetical protein